MLTRQCQWHRRIGKRISFRGHLTLEAYGKRVANNE